MSDFKFVTNNKKCGGKRGLIRGDDRKCYELIAEIYVFQFY